MDKENKKNQEFKQLDDIDPLIHSPTRLKVMTYLYLVENIDYVYLKRVTGLSWGNLSRHLTKLGEDRYCRCHGPCGLRIPKTLIWLTKTGREAFQKYKDNLQQIFKNLPD